MKRISISVAIATATLALTAIAGQTAPLSASNLQPNVPNNRIAQTPDAPPSNARPPRGNTLANDLGLTEAQRTQITEIRKNTRTQIDKILTDDQKQQLRQAMQANQGGSTNQDRPKGKPELNLSAEQKQQIQQILQSEQQQVFALLTPAQREKLRQARPKPAPQP